MYRPFSDEQTRTLVNLHQQYEGWIEAEQALAELPYDLRRKTVHGREYLYEIRDRSGNGRSLGPFSDALKERFDSYRAAKRAAKQRRDASAEKLQETARLYRALRLPLISSEAGAILREADRRRLLGERLMLVGTNALPAYALEAGGSFEAPMETEDLDLAWSARSLDPDREEIWPLLKAVDPTFTVNTERPFQARNAAAYEVELLVAPSRAHTLSRREQPQPIPLPEQEWLLCGRPIDRVVAGRDGAPARVFAPDPRWFALQKMWLSDQPKRNPLKRAKDRKQALELLDAIDIAMPHYPLDEAFRAGLPDELTDYLVEWSSNRPSRPPPAW
jgi:hypothetical protein